MSLPFEQKPHMIKKIFHCTLLMVMVISANSTSGLGSDVRETPLVRAIKRAKLSVVNIHSEKKSKNKDAFGSNRKINGMGTGIILDERGYIVTNYHVVDGVDALRVSLYDGSTYTAKTISFDQAKDLAIIKIEASKALTVMPAGTSSDLMLGETVIAVGNAFGYEHTVTSGIVSSLSRDVEVNDKQSYSDLIQTDASINPGNSGGPLLNLDGEVVGINVAIRAGAQRIGFAIPIDDARKVISRLLNIEHLENTSHGLIANDVKSGETRMLVVDSTKKGSPASKAGFKPGDIIKQAANKKIVDGADFERALLDHKVGDAIKVQVLRDEKLETVELTLAAVQNKTAPKNFPIVRANNDLDEADEKLWKQLGLRVDQLPKNQLHLVAPRYRGGMRVTKVRPGSTSEENGILEGDILVGLHVWETINESNISYVLDHPQIEDFNPLKFYILRGNETLYGHLTLSSSDD